MAQFSVTMGNIPTHPLQQFMRGLCYPAVALKFLHRHRLWPWVILPVLINGIIFFAVAMGVWLGLWPVFLRVAAYFQAMAADGEVIRSAITFLRVALWVAVFPVGCIAAAAFILLCGQCIASPFLDLLSERVECAALASALPSMGWRQFGRASLVAIRDLIWGCFYATVMAVPLFFLTFIPGAGPVAAGCIGAMLLAQQFIGLPLARRWVPYSTRWRIVLRHRWLCLGFGTVVMSMFAVPGLNLILLPVASAAGTLVYCDIKQAGLLDRA